MLAKFQGDRKSIVTLLINCLNLSFCSLKEYIKDEFINRIINNI